MYKLVDKYILQQFTSKVFMILIAFIVIFLLVDIVDHLDHIMDSHIPNLEIMYGTALLSLDVTAQLSCI